MMEFDATSVKEVDFEELDSAANCKRLESKPSSLATVVSHVPTVKSAKDRTNLALIIHNAT